MDTFWLVVGVLVFLLYVLDVLETFFGIVSLLFNLLCRGASGVLRAMRSE